MEQRTKILIQKVLWKMALLIPERFYIKLIYRLNMGTWPDLKHPTTFNEKLQWLKLYDRRSEYTMMVDKVEVKKYVAGIIGEEYVIPTLGVWDNPDDIDFNSLPEQFVLKCNHNSGLGMCICKDKNKLDIEKVKKELRRGLRQNYYKYWREWPYKNVPRKILAEKYMVDESGYELKDYKIFCFNGEPHIIEVDYDRFVDHMRNVYDKEWNFIKMEIEFPNNPQHIIPKPEKLCEMLELAKKLSAGIPHVRVDFYNINNKIYFGELTFFHGSGMEEFNPSCWNEKLGHLIKLPSGGSKY